MITINPYTEHEICRYNVLETATALQIAAEVFHSGKKWSLTSFEFRADRINRFAEMQD